MQDYEVVPTKIKDQARYVVVGEEGKILDDARGYGYKSMASAHKGYAHKVKFTIDKINAELDNAFKQSMETSRDE